MATCLLEYLTSYHFLLFIFVLVSLSSFSFLYFFSFISLAKPEEGSSMHIFIAVETAPDGSGPGGSGGNNYRKNTDRDCLLYSLRYTIECYRELLQKATFRFGIHLAPPRRTDKSI